MTQITVHRDHSPIVEKLDNTWECLSYEDKGITLIYSKLRNSQYLFDLVCNSESENERKNIISNFLREYNSCFSLIFITKQFLVAAVDHIRSIPLFYFKNTEKLILTTQPQDLSKSLGLNRLSENAIGEFHLSGYVHGPRTLFNDIHALEPGQQITWSPSNSTLNISNFFTYLPRPTTHKYSVSELILEFDSILNRIFSDLTSTLIDREVWIPLSGGLDSRLILCKFIEHGHRNIVTFSYGVHGNHEIEKAEKVARSLGVEWISCPSATSRHSRKLFNHVDRKRYAAYSGALQSAPVYLDYEAIHDLRKRNLLTDRSCIVNGYSGDFLFGGHIPEKLLFSPSLKNLVDAIISKHCSHYKQKIYPDFHESIKNSLLAEYTNLANTKDPEIICSAYENWEWLNRQPKAVVNGQRLYDFFGIDWELPLWDKRLVKFWSTVPLNLKVNQLLHLRYLNYYNYQESFSSLRSKNEVWPKHLKWLTPLIKLTDIFLGEKKRNWLYERAFYFGFFRNQLAFFSFGKYKSIISQTRQPRVIPLASQDYLKSLGLKTKSNKTKQ